MIIMYEHLMMLKIIMIEICHLVVFFHCVQDVVGLTDWWWGHASCCLLMTKTCCI